MRCLNELNQTVQAEKGNTVLPFGEGTNGGKSELGAEKQARICGPELLPADNR
jgi:hypothetical protein